jgi:hypothetical protein
MTKAEILFSYSTRRVRDSWYALGQLEITNASRIYNMGQLYKVTGSTGELEGCLVFCQKEYIGSGLPWDNAIIVNALYGEVSFGSDIISPNFLLIITAAELEAVTEAVDEEFLPFLEQEGENEASVSIPEAELNIILSSLGVPFISLDELEYSAEDIINLAIVPAMDEYYKWFPKTETVTYPINTANEMEVEYPTDAYAVLAVSIQQSGTQGTTNTMLRYLDEVVWNSASPVVSGGAGGREPHTQTSSWGALMLDRAARQGMINYMTRVHHTTVLKHGVRYLQATCNKYGFLQVTWAMKSRDWNEIEYARLGEVRKLATAYAQLIFAAIRTQSKTDIPGLVDYSSWISRGNTASEAVIKLWQEAAKFSGIMRGSF